MASFNAIEEALFPFNTPSPRRRIPNQPCVCARIFGGGALNAVGAATQNEKTLASRGRGERGYMQSITGAGSFDYLLEMIAEWY